MSNKVLLQISETSPADIALYVLFGQIPPDTKTAIINGFVVAILKNPPVITMLAVDSVMPSLELVQAIAEHYWPDKSWILSTTRAGKDTIVSIMCMR